MEKYYKFWRHHTLGWNIEATQQNKKSELQMDTNLNETEVMITYSKVIHIKDLQP